MFDIELKFEDQDQKFYMDCYVFKTLPTTAF